MKVTKAAQLLGHKGPLYALEQGPAPHLIYSGGSDGMIVQWDLSQPENGTLIASVPGVIYCIKKLGTQYLLVGTDKGGIHIIDLQSNTEIKYLLNHTGGVFDIQVLPGKNKFIAVGGDGAFSVWTNEFVCEKTIKLCNAKLRSADATTDDNTVAIACGDNTVRIFSTDTFNEIQRLENHSLSVNVVKFHPNGKFLLSGSRDAHLVVYDVADSFKVLQSIPAHNYAIYSIVFNHDAQLFATGSRDKTLKIWDAETFTVLKRVDKASAEGHVNSVNKLLWTNYNNLLVSTGDDRAILSWQVE